MHFWICICIWILHLHLGGVLGSLYNGAVQLIQMQLPMKSLLKSTPKNPDAPQMQMQLVGGVCLHLHLELDLQLDLPLVPGLSMGFPNKLGPMGRHGMQGMPAPMVGYPTFALKTGNGVAKSHNLLQSWSLAIKNSAPESPECPLQTSRLILHVYAISPCWWSLDLIWGGVLGQIFTDMPQSLIWESEMGQTNASIRSGGVVLVRNHGEAPGEGCTKRV